MSGYISLDLNSGLTIRPLDTAAFTATKQENGSIRIKSTVAGTSYLQLHVPHKLSVNCQITVEYEVRYISGALGKISINTHTDALHREGTQNVCNRQISNKSYFHKESLNGLTSDYRPYAVVIVGFFSPGDTVGEFEIRNIKVKLSKPSANNIEATSGLVPTKGRYWDAKDIRRSWTRRPVGMEQGEDEILLNSGDKIVVNRENSRVGHINTTKDDEILTITVDASELNGMYSVFLDTRDNVSTVSQKRAGFVDGPTTFTFHLPKLSKIDTNTVTVFMGSNQTGSVKIRGVGCTVYSRTAKTTETRFGALKKVDGEWVPYGGLENNNNSLFAYSDIPEVQTTASNIKLQFNNVENYNFTPVVQAQIQGTVTASYQYRVITSGVLPTEFFITFINLAGVAVEPSTIADGTVLTYISLNNL